jgi:hypothetical protein
MLRQENGRSMGARGRAYSHRIPPVNLKCLREKRRWELGLLIGIFEIDFNDFNSFFWGGLVSPHSDRIQGGVDQYRAASDCARIFDTAARSNNRFHFHLPAQFKLPRQSGVLRLNFRRGFPFAFSLIDFLGERGRL